MGSRIRGLCRLLFGFRQYKPQRFTLITAWRWLKQFPAVTRWNLLALIDHIRYISDRETLTSLTRGNKEVLRRLRSDGLNAQNIIYVSLDLAGSSSGVMLNLLRDAENMEQRHAKFIHSSEGDRMTRFTNDLGNGAIVYVDDFAGSGRQFRKNRDQIAAFIAGNFSEFFIAACMCEEAVQNIEEAGVVVLPGLIHLKRERPLHQDSDILPANVKENLIKVCREINPKEGLGYKELATMTVLAHNAPNSTPLIFRGSLGQTPYRGIFPRWKDLSIKTN